MTIAIKKNIKLTHWGYNDAVDRGFHLLLIKQMQMIKKKCAVTLIHAKQKKTTQKKKYAISNFN